VCRQPLAIALPVRSAPVIALRKPGPKAIVLEPQLNGLLRPFVGDGQRPALGFLEALDLAL
jgi:hypothetical protein